MINLLQLFALLTLLLTIYGVQFTTAREPLVAHPLSLLISEKQPNNLPMNAIERRQIKSSPGDELWIVPEPQVRQFKRRYFDSLAGQSLGKRSFPQNSNNQGWSGIDPTIIGTDIDPTEFLRQHLKYLMNRRL